MPTLADRLRLYLVADPELAIGDLVDSVRAALAGGVTAVQLRSKSLTDRETLSIALRLKAVCQPTGALFLINDRLDLALACAADGIHLGIDDLPIADARRFAGQDVVIGYSPETDEQLLQAVADGVDYFGVGPVYGTASKADAGPAIGLATIRSRAGLSTRPVIGIGGITSANAAAVIDQGAVGVAVISAILRATDPRAAAESLAAAVASGRG